MSGFEDEIKNAAVLATFVPLIVSSGGNSGSQATSLIIRSLALRELRLRQRGARLQNVGDRGHSRLVPRIGGILPSISRVASPATVRRW